jgi:3-oxoacyl-[acyl-carrier protein] reductase
VSDATDRPVMVITGTSRGMGRDMARYFLARGYDVRGCSRGESTITDAAYGHARVDVGDEEQVRSWVRSVKKGAGRIDVVVSNAGLAPAALLMTMTAGAVLEPLLRINVAGTFYVCREAARQMMTQGYGRIITISSMAVGLHEEGTAAYAASKAAVVEMTKILAKEVAARGITCNVLAPSMYETGAVEALGQPVKDRALGRLTFKRPLSIDEICGAIEFFAAPASGCVTGQVLHLGLVT